MKSNYRFILTVLLLCVLNACGVTDSEDISIEIKVVDRYQNAIPGARVSLTSPEVNRTANSEGVAVFSDLDEGSYQIQISAIYFGDTSVTVAVETGSITRETVQLERTSVPLRIVVENTIGYAIEGATVDLNPGDLQRTTSSNGYARFDDLVAGFYTYDISVPGFLAVSDTITVEPDRSTFRRVTLRRVNPITPFPRVSAAAGVIGDRLFIAGGDVLSPYGINYYYSTSVLEIYEPASNTWETGASAPEYFAAGVAGVIDGKLYVVERERYNSPVRLHMYDPSIDLWTYGSSLPSSRRDFSGTVVDRKLYVVGGRDSRASENLDLVEMYDPDLDSWTTRASLPRPLYLAAVGAIQGRMYVAGGSPADSTGLEMYDPQSDVWTSLTPMPTPRAEAMSAVVAGKLYVLGGYDSAWSETTVVEVFDPALNSWTVSAPLSSYRRNAALGVIAGQIYIFWGSVWGHDGTRTLLNSFEVYSP